MSVVIAAYNSARTIGEALASLQTQTFPDWEAIVVDDNSNDGTVDLVRTFLDDERIRLIELSQNGGSGRARNIAVQSATAPLIMILDADDVCVPNRVEVQLHAFRSDVELDVLGGQVAEFGEWGGPVVGGWPSSTVDIQSRIRREKMPVAHCAMMIKRTTFLSGGGYDEECKRAQDYALLRKLRAAKFAALDQVVVHYRTTRPITLKYVIMNGRYTKLAKIRTRLRSPRTTATVATFPASAATDLRSMVTWARRRIRERNF